MDAGVLGLHLTCSWVWCDAHGAVNALSGFARAGGSAKAGIGGGAAPACSGEKSRAKPRKKKEKKRAEGFLTMARSPGTAWLWKGGGGGPEHDSAVELRARRGSESGAGALERLQASRSGRVPPGEPLCAASWHAGIAEGRR